MTGEIRRQATIVTSDLKGSTALGERLDPESLREVLSTYFDEMRAVFESHGGTIEKIIGDAIVAGFGLATARDDDALRAVEAAAQSQRALALLNDRLEERWDVRLTVRTGIATGEVVVGEASSGQHVLTGSTIGVATAMEQNAPALEVLLDASTYEAVRDAVDVESVGDVRAKGSDEALAAYRLVSVAERPDAERLPATVEEAGTLTCRVCGEQNPESLRSCGMCGAQLAARATVGETRKTVTIVFADPKPTTVDGTPLSAGALRDVMSRYFTAMRQALDWHGATVEKFIGDAVMAVFGLPIRHEDDALRAVRAASDMQRALPDLNAAFAAEWGVTLQNHIGVNTGEVVAGDASLGQRLVTGDTVNVAARLEQAAGPREILLGALTYRLVRDAVTVEEVEPLALKGKAEPVPAYRLTGLTDAAEAIQRRHDAPMIGREAEMEALGQHFRHAVDERACRMATVVGDAGVGKTRLVGEFTAARAAEALIIHGRCLPYGEGITFWPLREAVRDAAGIGSDDPPAVAMARLRNRIGDDAVCDRLASVIGLSQSPFPIPEVYWGARKFLERLSSEKPLLLVIDDIHWAETIFLELIDHLVEAVESAPVLLLCTSRHELLDAHPAWATDANSLRLVLNPLTDADAARVVQGLLGGTGIADDAKGRIVQAAAGNPLFVEQLLSMLIDNGTLRNEDGRWEQVGDTTRLDVPPSIQALLAARLDLLEEGERTVIGPASVIGQTFAQAAVEVLVPQRVGPSVPEHLGALTRKQLVQANPESEMAEIGFRFQHLLVRDAAYDGLLKRARAELHERFVNWAEEFNARVGLDNREFEEIHGYHLEQAYRYLMELGRLDDSARLLGMRASRKLAAAGRRAMIRGDGPAAASLLRRGAAVLPADSLERGILLPRLAEAQLETGQFDDARATLVEARRVATVLSDERLDADAALVGLLMDVLTADQADWATTAAAEVARAIPIFERASDPAGLALAYRVLEYIHGTPGRYGEAAKAAERVIEFARLADERQLETRGMIGYAQMAVLGDTPVDEALAASERLVAEATGDRRAEALIRLSMAQLRAMRGDFEVARTLYRHAQSMLQEIGPGVVTASTSIDAAAVEVLAGDLEAAERALRADDASLAAMGEQYVRSTVLGLLARVLTLLGRLDEAAVVADETKGLAAADDVDPQVAWRTVRARLLRDSAIDQALALATEALELSRTADNPRLQASALVDLGDLYEAAGQRAEAEGAWSEAAALYAAKGDHVSAERVRLQAKRGAGSA
jgi:class 3 adenylate cyclase/tetratricopeptide (TPR) repeat protein